MTAHPHAKELAWQAIPVAEAALPSVRAAEVEVTLVSSTPWFGSEVYVEVAEPDGRSTRVEIAEGDDAESLVSKIRVAVAELLAE